MTNRSKSMLNSLGEIDLQVSKICKTKLQNKNQNKHCDLSKWRWVVDLSRMIAFSFAFDYWWSSIEFMSFTNWLHELVLWAGFMNWLLESTSPLNAIQHDSCGRFDAESKVSRSHSKWFKVIQSSSFHAVQMPGDGGRMLKLADQRAAAKFRPHTVLLHTGPYYTHN